MECSRQLSRRVSPDGVVPVVGPSGVAMRCEWIYSQRFDFPPREGGEVRILGFYNNKHTNKRLIKQPTGVVRVNKVTYMSLGYHQEITLVCICRLILNDL